MQGMQVLHSNERVDKMYLQRQNGFTLVEVLLVLFCVTIVLSVTFPIFVARLDQTLYEQAVQKLHITMYEAQYIAKEQGRRTMITVEEGNTVTISVDGVGVVSQWAMPQEMKLHLQKLNYAIRYTEEGRISKPGTIFIETPLWTKEYTINFTYGRMRER